jgi:hypothetical protein
MITVGGYTGTTSAAGRVGVAQFLTNNFVLVAASGAPAAPLAPPSVRTSGALPLEHTSTLLLATKDRDWDLLSSA